MARSQITYEPEEQADQQTGRPAGEPLIGAAPKESLRQLQDRLGPVTLSREQLLSVPEPLLPLFPFGGLQRGQSVGFEGAGSTSVALTLAAAALGNDRWMAVVGMEELGLLAASELGVRLDRLLLIETTAAAQLAPITAALVEAVDIIALNPRKRVGPRDARRLTARARERGTVLFHLDGGRTWPEAMHVHITAEPEGWEGLGEGHGHLTQRRLSVATTGRRSSFRQRRISVLLPGPDGGIAPIAGESPPVLTVEDGNGTVSTPLTDTATGTATDDEVFYARAG
ncbi:MAG: hypothetical protein OEV40_18205 [Acidimicrobiia bacterium]|nr:hypothetical protein [Acidimicrobiia bacterium]